MRGRVLHELGEGREEVAKVEARAIVAASLGALHKVEVGLASGQKVPVPKKKNGMAIKIRKCTRHSAE